MSGVETGVKRQVPIRAEGDIVSARQQVRSLAAEQGFSLTDQTLLATAVSELARNIIRYAKEGEIVLGVVQRDGQRGIEVVARDRGPGIPDIELAMRDGWSTSGSLGLGLPGTKRLTDQFEIVSQPGQGTTIRTVTWLR